MLFLNHKARKCFTVKSCCCGKIHLEDLVGMLQEVTLTEKQVAELKWNNYISVPNLSHCKVKCFNLNYQEMILLKGSK